MLGKYFFTLLVAVVAITAVCASLPFVTLARVRSGTTADEVWKCELTLDAGGDKYYVVNDDIKGILENGITFAGSGAATVISSKVEVTPQKVSWKEGDTNYTADGASMVAHVKWQTSADAPDGAAGEIYIQFPDLPGLNTTESLRSGGYQKEDNRWVFRQVTAYRNVASVFLGRFALGLGAGLPFAIVLHSIWWAFVLRKEKRSRLAALASPVNSTAATAASARTFYSSPIAEWTAWTWIIGGFAGLAGLFACFTIYDGFLSSVMYNVILIVMGIGALIALIVAYFVRRSVLTVRVEAQALSHVRGRGEPNWITARWTDLMGAEVKSKTYKGTKSEWVELRFADGTKLKIADRIGDYAVLRDVILTEYGKHHPNS